MKQKIFKKSFFIISLLIFSLMLFWSGFSVSASENSGKRDGYTISDIKELISNENYIEVYSEDGTMEIMDQPLSVYEEDATVNLTSLKAGTSFEEVKIADSGKPDSESIVVTLMGDGFTATEQNIFINAANNAVNYLIGNASTGDPGFYPYNLFRDYFTIYAIKVISEESGVSRDSNTNNGHIVNNYFGSSFYYGNNSSNIQRGLVITKNEKARALEKSESSMTAIICNSSRWGGTGGEFAVLSMHTNFGQILTHEFGHSFGGLADEYWYEGETFRTREAVNKTQNGNLNTIKWKHWIGRTGIYSGIGAYRFSSNSSHTAYNWYKPHKNCQMQYANQPFCAVCAEELINRMEAKTGSFFTTTNISDTQIKINKVNYTLYNDFEIPPVLNGKEVVFIGSSAFENQLNLTNIIIPNTVTNIDSSAFENCSYLQSVTLSSNLNSIGSSAFKGCGSLTSITIPSNVQYIDDSAFENCVNLNTMVVEREISNITNLGSNVFTGCSSTLQIEVPQNRLAEYKNKENWINYKNKIISDNYTFEEINLHCLIDGSKDVSINAGNNKLLKLNVECVKSYKFITNSDAKMVIYNFCFDTVYSGDNILYAYLNQGTYYIDIRHSSTTSNGTISIAYGLRWKENGEQLLYNQSLNLLTHLHETEDTYLKKIYYINYRGAGFYKFTLSGIDMNENPIVFGDDSLIIYNSSNRIENEILEKCPESSLTASLMQGQNTIYVYLPRNGYFYINILMPSNNYKTLNLTVSSIISQEINLFDLNEGENSIFSVLNNNNKGDYVKELNLKQSGKFTISYNYNGSQINDMLFVLSKLNYNEQTNKYSLETIISQLMDVENNAYTNTLNLTDGIYYIGYFNKKDTGTFNISFNRLVTEYNPNTLVTDPEKNTDCGSQINVYESDIDIYERSYRSTEIVKGFTRIIYFDVNLVNQYSRGDYYWYSSNNSVATVSQHGTVFGETCGNVKIMAVNKDNSSIVFVKEFTIIPDTKTYTTSKIIKINDTYKTSSNTDYKLGLTIQNSPYPMVQYYTWQIYYRDDTITSVQLDEYGNVVIKGTGEVIFWGKNYIYNNNYEIRIHVKVTE